MGCVVWKRKFPTAEEGRRRKARMERINLMIDGESVERERLEREGREGGRRKDAGRMQRKINQGRLLTNRGKGSE